MHFYLLSQQILIYDYKNDLKIICSSTIYQKHLYDYNNR